MEKMEIYNNLREVPQEAKKTITGGRLQGMTDISPMWRIKALTEQFGACGDGWYYDILDKQTYSVGNEIVATMDIALFYKLASGEWSEPIFGTGGSKLVQKEKNGLYVNDEAFKMALTDAISVCGKALGLAADVYWDKDNTKYNDKKKAEFVTKNDVKILKEMAEKHKQPIAGICKTYKVDQLEDMTKEQYADALKIFKGMQE